MRAALVVAVVACAAPRSSPAPTPAPSPAPTPLAQLEASTDIDGRVVGATSEPTVVVWLASWCGHCRNELAVFDELRATHPEVRWLAANYKAHEEYDGRGNSVAIRALASETPWLRVVPAGDALFAAFGSPPKIPTIFVYDRRGALVETYDRRDRALPDAAELGAALTAASTNQSD